MKIRRLEIQGFKSFADRTVLRFGEGITGVVGPNGCGKSNIVDAIRWVMGEQSAKHLRGSGMQDVIFAGSESRGPLGMAEVTLTFKNDGKLVPPEYQGLDEISVTRRLFRDGTSGYAINKVNCRLRDILDLFMGTGIGKNAYSIIEQGRIGLIVTAKPEDRRAIIEDAAGVSRYKARRKQAERRIHATEQNLLRVTDLTEELETRMKSLERQAKKAERYQRLRGELKGLELHSAAHRWLDLDARILFESRRVGGLRHDVETEEAGLAAEEEAISEAMEQQGEQDELLRERAAAISDDRAHLARAQSDAEHRVKEVSRLTERKVEAETEREALLGEQVQLQTDLDKAKMLGEVLSASDGDETLSLKQRLEALDELGKELEAAEAELDKQKSLMVDTLTTIAQSENTAGNLKRAGQDLEVQISRAQERRKAASARAKEVGKRAKEVDETLKKGRQLKLSLEDERTTIEASLAEVRAALNDSGRELEKDKEELSARRHRLDSLLEIRRNYEGCTDAVRHIMREKEGDSHIGESLHGLVADVLSAEPEYEAAVEAVLGDRLQYVIVNSQADGVRSIEFLKDEDHGRSSFIPLDLREDHVSWLPRAVSSLPPINAGASMGMEMAGASHVDLEVAERAEPSAVPSPAMDLPTATPAPIADMAMQDVAITPLELWPDLDEAGVRGKMVDLVRAQPGYEHVARVLLGDVVVVENLEKARNVWEKNGHLKTLVTLSGEVLDPVGVLTGGSVESKTAGMLAQKREIDELREQVQALEARTQVGQERVGTHEKRAQDLADSLERLSNQKHEEELSLVNLERELEKLKEEVGRDEDEARSRGEELEMLRKQRGSVEEEVSRSLVEVNKLADDKKSLEDTVQSQAARTAELKETVRRSSEELTELKVMVAANREKRDSAAQTIISLTERLEDVSRRLQRLNEVIETSKTELEALSGSDDEVREQLATLEKNLAGATAALATDRAAFEEQAKLLRTRDTEARERRGHIDELKESASEAVLSMREYELARAALDEQIDERYRLDLADIITDYHLLAPPTEEAEKAVAKLRRQLDQIGPINLTAVEEFAEVQERYSFLAKQKDDLERAIGALRAAIRKINKTSKERYVEAFRLVNEKFQMVFPRMFNGGRCALVLTDESDPLESGIEILAQPPGKKLQSVTLLSGGEKALTAVALIFGIFLIKPTPFCLLDEVDAPLDEANVGRYNDMVHSMSELSQFILITHNKRTMELPDRLYGVTMEEPGISKIVPVDVRSSESKAKGHLEAV